MQKKRGRPAKDKIEAAPVEAKPAKRKRGRPSKAELNRRQNDRAWIEESNKKYEQEFERRLLKQMHRQDMTQVAFYQVADLMKAHNPTDWFFFDRGVIRSMVGELLRSHGWTTIHDEQMDMILVPPTAS
jgi:hypothetical protein